MKYILIFCILLLLIILYKKYKNEYFTIEYINRELVGNAQCIKDDIELSNSYFNCQMSKIYLPININVNVVKYQNFIPYLNKTPSASFNLLSTLTPSLTSPPLFPDPDFTLIGTTTNPNTMDVTLNDYTKIMKVFNYNSNLNLFDPLPDVTPVKSSLDDNNFSYLPDSVVNYINYLNDINLLLPDINLNEIDTLPKIASQFNLYLQGQLIPIVKPSTDTFRLQREIVITYDYPSKKNIINIQFNETMSWYDSDNNLQTNNTSKNINTLYDYLIIYSCNNISTSTINLIINTVRMYGSYLKSRNLINDYLIDELVDKITNYEQNNILYINYYYTDDPYDTGIQLIKRVDGNLISMNYFDINAVDPNVPYSYYKNICPNPLSEISYKGRCYSECPNGYSSIGLACILDSKKDLLFNPDSNYCSQVCNASNTDIRNFDPVLQQACWCKSATCDKCGEFSIDHCKC